VSKYLLGSTWLCVIAATAAVYFLPVPFGDSLLLGLGIVNGWLLRRAI